LLRRSAPRNDTKRRLLAQAHQGRGGNAIVNDYQKFVLLKLKDKIINLFGTMRLRGEI